MDRKLHTGMPSCRH